MKYMRRTAGYTWTDYKTNSHIAKELEITPVLDKLLEYKRNWIQHVNRMPRDRLPRIKKHYSPTGRRNRGRRLKRLLDTWDRNGTTSGLTPWPTYDDDDDDDDDVSLYEGESNENLKIAAKIQTTARFSCKLTTVVLMVYILKNQLFALKYTLKYSLIKKI